jgi:multicomponent Na+:H+ antiporter subunit E
MGADKRLRVAATRAAAFLGLWLVLAGADPAGLPVGAMAAILATWASLRLLPAGTWRPRPASVARLVLRFLRQSVVAGVDVAWRALDPRLPLRPGFVIYPARLPPGATRDVFCTLTSLLPGTVPAGPDETGSLVIHCLDARQPILADLSREEALLMRAVGGDG